ncbi:MAG: outer membrane protein assembly factor BamA [Endomicrobiia bacterium]|nr:MAG: outer membrane protein assembly factor BamA [Endomicrobiia bacterium]
MKIRYIFVLIFIFMFFSVHSYADSYVVSNVLISGLRNASLKSVLSVVSLKKGERYSKYQARKDVASIVGLGYFNDVKFHFNKQSRSLVFEVSEDPFIERVVFRGNSEFSTRKLKSVSTLKEKDYYNFSKLEETKKNISTLYVNKGYVDCKIEVYPTVNVETNKMTLTFLITENNKIIIGDIKIDGVVYFKEKEILKVMKTKFKKVFKEDIYQMDLKSIEKFYKNNGFIDYQFISLTTKYNDTKTEMFITLNINEGNRYKIDSVTYDGNFIVDDKQMKKVIRVKNGEIFDQYKVEEAVDRIRKSYFNKGYLKVVVKPCFNKKDISGTVDLNFLVEENEVFYLGNIYINGLLSTKDKVIRREILLKPGNVLMIKKLLRSIERIYNLGFIENVEYNELPTEVFNIFDLEFYVTENAKKSNFNAGLGYSASESFKSIVGLVQLQHMNIFGLGQKLNLFCELGKGRQNYEIDWTEPWIFDRNMSLGLNVYKRDDIRYRKNDNNDWESEVSKEKIMENDKRTGFKVNLGPRISELVSLSFGYKYENVDFRSIEKEKGKISSVFSNFLYDSRNYVFDPSKGNLQSVTLQVASDVLGGNKNFIRGTVDSKWFFPTFWRFVLSANLRVGLVTSYGNESVPIYERFYIGGADTIRGYDRDEIKFCMGGKLMGIINVEYRFPIISQSDRTVVQGFLFYDIGGLWERKGTGRKLYQSVGFGVRLPIPMFPIKFDCAYGLNQTKGKLKFYFNLGNIF